MMRHNKRQHKTKCREDSGRVFGTMKHGAFTQKMEGASYVHRLLPASVGPEFSKKDDAGGPINSLSVGKEGK
ncbi:hypothetical protein SAMN04488090_0560 [Siphonobacter aquaeclarae]|uniref:Uncharacterized protein n=1 Tax=Siphonobacter aquaeclarae TaxID=563176 RepID=A0A1G9IPC7_9BACT|nr:hypothetical protein SAMN04488090_0560 [Siphonobacter aquaeclarae]